MTRNHFQAELDDLNSLIVQVAELSGKALSEAIDALFTNNLEMANNVVRNDIHIDRGELEINDKVVVLIAKQQPVATDLRRIIVFLRIATDIERMADNAKNIAQSTILLENNNIPKLDNLKKLHDVVQNMLEKAIIAFKNEDVNIAKELGEIDDDVDRLYNNIVSELLGMTATNPDKIQYIMQLAFCARYLERFADHITNIGESVLFLVKGINYDLN
ncbi:phosphate signaling complex protein PhoU [Oceanobacillus sp. Castelsardo]|uniref:phosphate signaling complex protein PhoU n=1 Tax=Oceanobacillus sp. Castelsardo TaxID=1851204 RepID=UPI000838B62E|nr:phosphate signaling complex protein PhoU [Oceanobacillus sp. Castelsardo]